MFLISYLIRLTNALLRYFFPTVEMEQNTQKIFVKLGSGVVPVYLNQDWTVSDLKESVKSKVNIDAVDELHIIFAGRELNDDMLLRDFDVGEQSVIHAVSSRKSDSASEKCTSSTIPISACLLGNDNNNDSSDIGKAKKAHFFVYCNDPCDSMVPGKLRVRCYTCKEGAFTLSREPTCWNDVLKPSHIHGTCHAENCDGTIAEFYFKCATHVSLPGDSAVALYLIKNNFKTVPCIACTDVSSLVLVFPCADGHVICLDCFRLYCQSSLNERKFVQDTVVGYTINCAAGCPDSLIVEPHHFKLLGEEQYSRYQRFAAEECVLQAGGVLCPQPGCGAGIIPDPVCRRITCSVEGGSGCGFVFCRLCLQGYHIGPCESQLPSESSNSVGYVITDERAGSSKWDEDSRKVIKSTTKPCPKCRTPTERDGGCMHMVCTRSQCNFHWCWICQDKWTRDCMGSHWFD